ncbi:hypothetical protein PG994_003223 [Apiospora phragmitis]|uniref:Uncharacterized protein n=1 Tax=Apiospora phragmitis TaxID=2905665 RepID=A0ABR1W066_9PEZI
MWRKEWIALYRNKHFRGLRVEEEAALAKRGTSSSGSRAKKRRGSMMEQALLPIPPQSSQPARGSSPIFAGPEGHHSPEMEEEEEEVGTETNESSTFRAGQQGPDFASSPPPPETGDLMNMDLDEFMYDSDPKPSSGLNQPASSRTPIQGPSRRRSSTCYPYPSEDPPSPRGRPSPILGASHLDRHHNPTPARSESGLLVSQVSRTPVPAPRPWEGLERRKREDTISPLLHECVAAKGKGSQKCYGGTVQPASGRAAEEKEKHRRIRPKSFAIFEQGHQDKC